MAKRGVPVTSETVRDWRRKFGPVYAPGEQEASSVRGEMALGRSVHHDWKGASTTCGEPWARTELSSTFWCNRDPIVVQLCVSFASCDAERRSRIIATDKLRSYTAAKSLILPNGDSPSEPLSQ
jgi:hypothetical protein